MRMQIPVSATIYASCLQTNNTAQKKELMRVRSPEGSELFCFLTDG